MIAREFYPVRDRQAYCLYIQRPPSGRRYTNSFRGEPRTPFLRKRRCRYIEDPQAFQSYRHLLINPHDKSNNIIYLYAYQIPV